MVLFAIVGELGCHSQDTKVLTPNGIKDWKEIKVGDKVYAVDPLMRIIETTVRKVWVYDYNGKMINFKSDRYDFLVTPNHRMLFATGWNKNFKYIEAKDIVNKRINGYLPVSFWFDGLNNDTINLENFISVNKNKKYIFKTDDFLSLLGFFLSEGYLQKYDGKNIRYPTIANENRIDKIKNLLDRMNLKYGFYEDRKFMIFNSNIGRFFEKYCYTNDGIKHAPFKKIPPFILNYSPKHLFSLFESMMLGDGSLNHVYYTSSEQLANDFIILTLKLGFNPHIRVRLNKKKSNINGRPIQQKYPQYEIGISYTPKGWFTSSPDKSWYGHINYKIVDYEGKVFSFTTDAGNYFTIRNGKIGVSGNSGKTLTLTYLAWHNWFNRGRRIYSNMNLYGIPFTKITTIQDLNSIKNGFAIFDELWLSLSSWSRSKFLEFISTILLKSRKRGLTVAFTTQTIGQINRRIRQVTDFIAYPLLSPDNEYCRVEVFRGPTPSVSTRINPPIYYEVEPIYAIYNTREEVAPFTPEDELTLKEMFLPITKNTAWIYYLKKFKKLKKMAEIRRYSERIMDKINPARIQSESERDVESDVVI